MRIFILSESPLDKIGNDYYAVDPWIRIPAQLSEKCEKVTVWSPVAVYPNGSVPRPGSWKVDIKKLKIEHHDYYFRFIQYYKLLPRRIFHWRRKAAELIRQHDLVIIRAPSPMTPLLMNAAKREKKPVVLMLLLNIATQSDRLLSSSGIKKILYTAIIRMMILKEKKAVKNAQLVYVYSKELVERHEGCKHIRLIQDPHLSLKDIVVREDTCQSPEQIRILRICWLIPTKGVEYLLEATALLIKKGLPIKLEIAGQERTTGYQEGLEKRVKELGLEKYVVFSGWAPFNQVAEVYSRNDIQVISSLGEGTPRCIVEGFAHGLPLVCTAVGGCQDTLINERDALLVPPANPEAMATAIERLIQDGNLRRQMIQQGYKLARSVTFEKLGTQFLEEIKNLLIPG